MCIEIKTSKNRYLDRIQKNRSHSIKKRSVICFLLVKLDFQDLLILLLIL